MRWLILSILIISNTSCDEPADLMPPVIEETESETEIEKQIFNWFDQQQLANGLIETQENGGLVSLYDNALAAMVYMLREDYSKAEKIFDFFDARIDSELTNGVGGFSQFRNVNGVPNRHRWMGDNAWLLIALNNYKARTTNNQYDQLAEEISSWLISLQDNDGGLFAGFNANDERLNYKVTEGNIDAFNAVIGYSTFHEKLLRYLEKERWDSTDQNLVSWPTNPPFLYALDLHSWAYLMFEGYPISALTSASRYLNTQESVVSGLDVTGYCFDEDRDVVWLEGTAQMAVAFGHANLFQEKERYLSEIEKNIIMSSIHSNASGFPYASNHGTSYGPDELWDGATDRIALSSGAWYLFATNDFNPFSVELNKAIPIEDMFWLK